MVSMSGPAMTVTRRPARVATLGLVAAIVAALLAVMSFGRTAEASVSGSTRVEGNSVASVAGVGAGAGGSAYQDGEATPTPTPQLYVEEEDRREDVIIPMAIIMFVGITVLGILFGVYGYLRQ